MESLIILLFPINPQYHMVPLCLTPILRLAKRPTMMLVHILHNMAHKCQKNNFLMSHPIYAPYYYYYPPAYPAYYPPFAGV